MRGQRQSFSSEHGCAAVSWHEPALREGQWRAHPEGREVREPGGEEVVVDHGQAAVGGPAAAAAT